MEKPTGSEGSPLEISKERYGAKIRTEPLFKEGYEGRIARFEIFDGTSLEGSHGYSWGDKAKSMSYKLNELKSKKFSGEQIKKVIGNRVRTFLGSLGIDYPGKGIIHMTGKFDHPQEQYRAVNFNTLNTEIDETDLNVNFAYSVQEKDDIEGVPVIIRPGDCNIVILHAKNRSGQDIAGFIHLSAISVNAGIPRHAIEYLINTEDVDISTIRLGITPGVFAENYSMAEAEELEQGELVELDST